MTTRVFCTPNTNSQRSALARFGSDWELVPGFQPFRTLHAGVCRFICPVGQPRQARWVSVEQIKLKEEI